MAEKRLVRLRGLKRLILFDGTVELLDLCNRVFADFSEESRAHMNRDNLAAVIRRDSDWYVRRSRWLPEAVRHNDALEAVCDLTVDYFHCFSEDNPGTLCLHTAAAKVGSGLMLFPGYYRQGKSLFTAHLAAQGIEIFTDDALPVDDDNGFGTAMGLYPRLRQPLPDTTPGAVLSFIRSRISVENQNYIYLALKPGELAEFGTREKITGITLLHRERGRTAELEEVSRAAVVKELILRNFAKDIEALEILDRVMAMVAASDCYRLCYDDPAQAAALIARELA